MELHKAIKEIVLSKGPEMINNIQIINYLLDYQAFKEKPATKLILRDVINAGYAESILALQNTQGWQIKFHQYEHEFIDSCGYKEELTVYVFESLAYALGLNDGENEEPAIKPSFKVDSFFDIPEDEVQQPINSPQNTNKQNPDPTDLYTIALSFYNEGKYQQAKGFIEKTINTQPNASIPSNHLRLLGDIYMKLGDYEEAIKCLNECFTQKAKEDRCTIDQLRESFKQHKVTGYENILFNYFFCLYSAKRLSDCQWLKFVKAEAMFGLNDAILFCVKNGINPMENHMDIFFVDKNKLYTGDYLYSDGTFAHELSTQKTLIARVIKTETTEYEKSQGWLNGYLLPVDKDGRAYTSDNIMWSTANEDLPFPHSHYTQDDINHWQEIKTIESEHYIDIKDFSKFPAFRTVRDFPVKIPLLGASKWFLPNIHWFKRCRPTRLISLGDFWTSSQADISKAIYVKYDISSYKRSYYYTDSFGLAEKKECKKVLPISAF